ncbi:NHL repeat-containing protein [Anianabacter salinae]|uniref:hypothetical protein n=1 Tax=Anianabacter salinae TaxID=2851023 RepID=UPI00225E575A|nr:hypothetical protein [Anianabacter salinae]MBV0910984.1 hypothetical protein [Anianabacter salinae]
MRRLALAASLAALPVQALELRLSGFYDLNRPASLDYDPGFCGLWIANEGPETILVTLDGLELRRFGSDLYRIKAISLDGDGLLVSDGSGSYQRLSKDGAARGAPFQLAGVRAMTEGIAVDDDGTLILVEDDPARILWVTPGGEVLREIDGNSYEPRLTEPQGIARDPRTGHLLVVDDWEGTNSLFELDAEGRLLGVTPLIQYGRDPEGIAIRPGANLVFMAFDGGARIAAFDYVPTVAEGAEPPDPGADCAIS